MGRRLDTGRRNHGHDSERDPHLRHDGHLHGQADRDGQGRQHGQRHGFRSGGSGDTGPDWHAYAHADGAGITAPVPAPACLLVSLALIGGAMLVMAARKK